jgi:hypothetical protein
LYYENTDGKPEVLVSLKARIDGRFEAIEKAEVVIISENDTTDNELGSIFTDKKGEARLVCDKSKILTSPDGLLLLKASYKGDSIYGRGSKSIEVIPSAIQMVTGERRVTVKMQKLTGDSTLTEGTSVGLFVKRLYSWQKVGEATLENGQASIDFPEELISANGEKILISVMVDDEEMGKMRSTAQVNWGATASFPDVTRHKATQHYLLFMLLATMAALSIAFIIQRNIKLNKA